MERKQHRFEEDQVVEHVKHYNSGALTTTVQLTRNDEAVRLTVGAAFAVYLPQPVTARGMTMTIYVVSRTAGAATVTAPGSEVAVSLTMDLTDDHVVLFCDGRAWFVVLNVIA